MVTGPSRKTLPLPRKATLKTHVYNRAPLPSSCKVASGKNSAVGARLGIMCQCSRGPYWDFKVAGATKSPLIEAEEPLC